MKNIVFLTGAGISAESGISTFRDSNGLWEKHQIEDVATPQGWGRNPNLVNDFYNTRREEIRNSAPNNAHYSITQLQNDYNVTVITQNIDDLHERAGNESVIHLHGEIMLARSSNPNDPIPHKKYPVGKDGLNEYRDLADDGYPLRPHVVWFGESVNNYFLAKDLIENADIFVVVGTSLNVFPVADLICFAPEESYNINPDVDVNIKGFTNINKTASDGILDLFVDYL